MNLKLLALKRVKMKKGDFEKKNVFSDVIKNTEYGIYGHLDKPFK